MPEYTDPKSGRRLFHENEITLAIEKNILEKFRRKDSTYTHSYMHRSASENEVVDAERAVDSKGKGIVRSDSKIHLYDIEYKLVGMIVVSHNINTGQPLDEKQLVDMQKQLEKLWRIKEDDGFFS
jgi:hypothetical protein